MAKAIQASLKSYTDNFLTYAKAQVAELLKGMDADIAPSCCYDYYRAAGADNELMKDAASLLEWVKEDVEWDGPTEDLSKRAPMGDENEPLEKLEVLQKDYNDLAKVTRDAIEQMTGLKKRVEELEQSPAPRALIGNVVPRPEDTFLGKTVHSEDDQLAVLNEMLVKHGPEGMATMMIKAAHASGGKQLTLNR